MDLPLIPLLLQHLMHLPVPRQPRHARKSVPDNLDEKVRPMVVHHLVVVQMLVRIIPQFHHRPRQYRCQQRLQRLSR